MYIYTRNEDIGPCIQLSLYTLYIYMYMYIYIYIWKVEGKSW